MKILVLVVTFNGESWVKKCLDSLISCSIPVEVLCIDNNSTDSTCQIIKKNYPSVKLIECENNFGFGKANNIGLRFARKHKFDFVLLLNQDVYIKKNTLENLINISLKYPEYGVISPIHLDGSGEKLDSNFSNFIRETRCPYLISDYLLGADLKDVYSLDFVNAAAWLLPIKTVEIIGGFDPMFLHYGEDDNFCQRVLFHGLRIGIVPKTFIVHDRSQVVKCQDRYENLILFERSIKINCGNINKPLQKSFKWNLKDLKRKLLISFLTLNFFGIQKWVQFYFHLKSILPQIIKSREINKIIGPNYLNE